MGGLGTALKPAHEPIIVARKPLIGTVAANVLAHGTGAINVDGCRVGADGGTAGATRGDKPGTSLDGSLDGSLNGPAAKPVPGMGRWPANIILDEDTAAMLDEQAAGASRFFYVAKCSKAERNAGLDGFEERIKPLMGEFKENPGWLTPKSSPTARANHHPTVKPIQLMRYLCRLVTPPGGVVLDPFTGSGSTGCAAIQEALSFVGIEKEADYVKIANARLAHWEKEKEKTDKAIAAVVEAAAKVLDKPTR